MFGFKRYIIGTSENNFLHINFNTMITNAFDWSKTSEISHVIDKVYYDCEDDPTIFYDYEAAENTLKEIRTNENIKFENINIIGKIIDEKNGFKFDTSKLNIYELKPTEIKENEEIYDLLALSVCKLNLDTGKHERIYEFIGNFEDAFLLSQLAMCGKKENELIFIFPGWNFGINRERYKKSYEKALKLAEKYKVEKR